MTKEVKSRGLANSRIIDSISGTNIQVLFEFPTNNVQKSLYLYMPDMITVSHSVSRAKIPVTLMGETTLSGIALGSKMVAGSIVKLVTSEDTITNYIHKFVDDRYNHIKGADLSMGFIRPMSTYNEVSDYMRDDLAPFNIHLISTSEHMTGDKDEPKIDSILGCTIINSGRVDSIENLISEETLSFMAKSVRYADDINTPVRTVDPGKQAKHIVSGSSLLYGYLRDKA